MAPVVACSSWRRLALLCRDSPMASFAGEVVVRLLLLFAFLYAEFAIAEMHVIQREDLWRYRYPYIESRVPFGDLCITILVSAAVVFYWFGVHKKFHGYSEYAPAIFGFTCSVFFTGVITNFTKSFVGRPRPNYLTRCYGPEEYLKVTDASTPCLDSGDWLGDLRKSFPSGHSSRFGYLSLYIAGKLGTFNSKGRGSMWRLVIPFLPTYAAVWVAATRFTDYHHHFDDIVCGSVLGIIIAYASYRRYYPSLSEEFAHYPYKWLDLGILAHEQQLGSVASRSLQRGHASSKDLEEPLIGDESFPSADSSSKDSKANIVVQIRKLASSNSGAGSKWAIDVSRERTDALVLSPEELEELRREIHVALGNLQYSGMNSH